MYHENRIIAYITYSQMSENRQIASKTREDCTEFQRSRPQQITELKS